MSTIIAFGHRKRVGKNLAGELLYKNLLIDYSKLGIEKTSFAEPMYRILNDLYGWAGFKTLEYYEEHGDEKEMLLPALDKTPRQLLIEFGTHAMREVIYENTWIDYLIQSAYKEIIIVTDLRFPNEFQAIRDAGGYCIKINRDSVAKSHDVADTALADMPDENWNWIINNNGTKRDLNDKIMEIWNTICIEKGICANG